MPLEIYPFATAQGKAVPAEFIYPNGMFIINVTQATMGASLTIFSGEDDGIFTAYVVGSPIVIKTGAYPIAVPGEDSLIADSMILLPDNHYNIYWPDSQLSAVGLAGSAQLILNRIKPWKALAVPEQFDRG